MQAIIKNDKGYSLYNIPDNSSLEPTVGAFH